MIRVDFDPDKIPGTTLLTVDELTDAGALALRLRDAAEKLSEYLFGQLSPALQQQLTAFDETAGPGDSFRQPLTDELNLLIASTGPIKDWVLAGFDLPRNFLIRELVKQSPAGDDLRRLKRLILEDAYPQSVAQSPKAEWDGWTSLAEEARQRVIEHWENSQLVSQEPLAEFVPEWEADIWKGYRDWFAKYVFHDKCAYCETYYVGYIPDAEHFRPKGQVRTKSGIVKTLSIDGSSETVHPGYFWLAYNWKNLLPSCNTCNRYQGKKDQFPAKNPHRGVSMITDPQLIKNLRQAQRAASRAHANVYYLEPEDLDDIETRLLLHPCFDEPEKELHFRLDGKAEERGGSERAKNSIDVFDLNESKKVTARSRAQNDDRNRYLDEMKMALPDENRMRQTARRIWDEYHEGSRPYGAAVFDSIRHFVANSLLDPAVLLGKTASKD